MKKILLLIFLFISFSFVHSQTYLISDGGTVSSCAGDFYDSGGGGGSYGASENFTITFHSTSPTNTHIKMSFNQFDVDPSDTLYIYDGPTTASPLLAAFNNTNNPSSTAVQASIYNSSGDLTFSFHSNNITQATGWFASLVCIPICEEVLAAIDTLMNNPLPSDSGYIDICLGDTITFAALGAGPGVFPQDNILYDQDSSTTLFIWDFGDGTIDTGRVINHYYPSVHGYDVGLHVIDVNGCSNTNFIRLRVRISGNPIGAVNPLPNICSRSDTMEITVGYGINNVIQVVPVVSNQGASQSFDSTMFVPDGPYCPIGQCYNTDVTFTAFAPGATITSASDILSICVNMEHSYLGDLGFTIYCPNGQNVNLDPNTHSGGAYLGEPYGGNSHDTYDDDTYPCDPAYNPPGVGWTYCWSEIYPQQGTMDILSNSGGGYGSTGMSVDSTHLLTNTKYITSENPLSGLIGCPLNGTWNIQICDDFGIDNGYIFSWTLNLDPSLLLTTSWSYDVPIDSFAWGGNYIIGSTDSSIFVYPNTGGTYTYSLTIYDAYGCTYDTSLAVTVVTSPSVDLGADTSLCNGNTLMLDAGNPGSVFNWSTGEGTQNIFVTHSDVYGVTVTNTDGASLFCTDSDSINVIFFPMPVVDLGPDTCFESSVTLFADTNSFFQYLWQNGSTAESFTVNTSGYYYVDVTSGVGSPCKTSDTINIKIIPHPVVDLGSDTTICAQRSVMLYADQAPSSPDYTYQWIPAVGNASSVSFTPNGVPGIYPIIVVKTGCTSESDTLYVEGILCEVTVPNVFTPNGDGYNDYFVVEGLENYPNTTVVIYNRWGRKVYESSNYQNDWDGGGYHDGVYFYIITFPDYYKPMTGTVTILSQ